MLVGGILLELPILRIVLSQFLPHKQNKWINVNVVSLFILILFMNTSKDLDDIFFIIATSQGLIVILFIVLKLQEILNMEK